MASHAQIAHLRHVGRIVGQPDPRAMIAADASVSTSAGTGRVVS
jgi:hypothetical protein